MGFYPTLFVVLVVAACAPVLSAPVPDQVYRDAQYNDFAPMGHPGPAMMDMDTAGYSMLPILPKRSMPDFDTIFETRDMVHLPNLQSTSRPTRTYSKRMGFNTESLGKAFGFFRDIMDEGVAVDATSSDALHLQAGSQGSKSSSGTTTSPQPLTTPNIVNHNP